MIKILIIISAVLGVLSAIITISGFVFDLRGWIGVGEETNRSETTAIVASPTPIPTTKMPTASPFPTSTPLPTKLVSLDEMLQAAQTGTTADGQDLAVREVAKIAINRREYKKAIEAGERSSTYRGESETLHLVAHLLSEKGEYAYALEAATTITLDEHLDSTRLDVLCSIKDGLLSVPKSNVFQVPLLPDRYPSLDDMLAKSALFGTYRGEASALRKVAEIAIVLGEFDYAVEAGSATTLDEPASETLTYVARCAVEEGRFDYALRASNAIPTYSHRDKMKVEVLAAITASSLQPFSAFVDPASSSCR